MAYIDTSLLGSYYCPETLSAVVTQALIGARQPLISSLVEVEFCSLIGLKIRNGELTGADGRKIVALFQQHLAGYRYVVTGLTDADYATARMWLAGFATPLRTLDALHLACAYNRGEALWTTDKNLARAAAALNVAHRLIT